MNKRVIICRGIPGSGKTTWAKKYVSEDPAKRIRINRDDIRNMLGVYWEPSREPLVNDMYINALQSALKRGFDEIILDNMNLNSNTCLEIEEIVAKHNVQYPMYDPGYEVEYKDFFIPLEEAIERDSLRANPIGASIIKSIYHKYRTLFNKEQNKRPILKQNQSLPTALIVDLDGCLAINTSNRSYYGQEADEGYLNDSLNEELKLFILKTSVTHILIITGREGTPLGQTNTVKWLKENFNDYTFLYMRKAGDHRPDEIVKKEIFETEIKDNFNVVGVIDDRDKVVKMWRDLGLLCLQPWYGKF